MTCKKRFKTLRDSYRAEVRKIQQKRIRMSNWPYFRSLEFLREIFDPQCLVPFPPEPFDVGAEQVEDFELSGLGDFAIDVDVDLDNDDSVDFEIIEDIFKRESAERQDSGSDRGSLTQPLVDCSTANKLPISDPELSPRLLSPLNLPPITRRCLAHRHHRRGAVGERPRPRATDLFRVATAVIRIR